jgi:LysR family transcriptional regulator, glycine cleavage system transcriptional activator
LRTGWAALLQPREPHARNLRISCNDRDARIGQGVKYRDAMRRVSTTTTTPGFASIWLIPRLAKFTVNHPQVDVRISATLDVLDLARAQLDVAVRFCPIVSDIGRPLFEEMVQPVC